MSNMRDSVFPGYPNTEKRVENLDDTRSVLIKYEALSRVTDSIEAKTKQ